jgi:hypothetical protein
MLIRREQNLIWMAVICWENEIKSKVMCRRCMGSDRSIWTYRATIITVGSGTCLIWSIRVIKWWNLTSYSQQTRHHWSWTTKIQILGFKTRCLWKLTIVWKIILPFWEISLGISSTTKLWTNLYRFQGSTLVRKTQINLSKFRPNSRCLASTVIWITI